MVYGLAFKDFLNVKFLFIRTPTEDAPSLKNILRILLR